MAPIGAVIWPSGVPVMPRNSRVPRASNSAPGAVRNSVLVPAGQSTAEPEFDEPRIAVRASVEIAGRHRRSTGGETVSLERIEHSAKILALVTSVICVLALGYSMIGAKCMPGDYPCGAALEAKE
jgi:hypothetical protein